MALLDIEDALGSHLQGLSRLDILFRQSEQYITVLCACVLYRGVRLDIMFRNTGMAQSGPGAHCTDNAM